VKEPFYRRLNLEDNNIYLRRRCEPYPKHIETLVNRAGKYRIFLGRSLDDIDQDAELEDLERGATESDVIDYFKNNLFTKPTSANTLKQSNYFPMSTCAVPQTTSIYKISIPQPDILYGYRYEAFPQQITQLRSQGTNIMANSQGLIYPFLLIEFNSDSLSGDNSLWAVTNQCLAGAACCVNLTENLNDWLKQSQSGSINSAIFSIAISGTEARLYVSWKHGVNYYMQRVKGFLLQEPEQHRDFCKYVLNIIDWGEGERLREIRESLNKIPDKSKTTPGTASTSVGRYRKRKAPDDELFHGEDEVEEETADS
jgi:hypothetical protein